MPAFFPAGTPLGLSISRMGTRLLVVGGDAAGMSAAVQARRRAPDLEIVAVERTRWTSYSACGIPYLTGGVIRSLDDLVVRRPDEFRATRIDVRVEHEVVAIDLDARKAEVHNLAHPRSFQLGFDMLHLATGARPVRAGITGCELPHVHGVQTLDDAARLMEDAKRRRPSSVAVVGSGYIGLEMAEAFSSRGAEVTVIEHGEQVMNRLDPDMGARVARAMRESGINVETGTTATSINEKAVETSAGDIPADLVILGMGVEPAGDLAEGAGLEIGPTGGIVVDRRQRTSAEGVWAAGDCCQSVHAISGRPVYEPLGTVANKQGRVAGINITGGYATFPGVLGTAVTRICHLEIGRTGFNEEEAASSGFEALATSVESTTTAGYMPDSKPTIVKLLAERVTRRVLGMQTVGGPGSAKRVDVLAAALAGGLTVDDLIGLDLSYAPPFSPLWDPLQIAARSLAAEL
jgi:NADPH-dependent 2,4-dienoyl-CoA reductase/sulfur reductase-like enzyme